MSLPIKKTEHISLAISLFALAIIGIFAAYHYQVSRNLQNQVNILARALGNAGIVDGEDSEQLAALGTLVRAGSQDALLTSAVARVAPAVVSIVISKDVPKLQIQYENPFGNDPRYRQFNIRIPRYRHIGTERQKIGAGTGFLVQENGYIVTNRHVVEDREAEYTILLSTGEQKNARIVYVDDVHDLAVVKIEGSGYPTVSLGDSSTLQLGQTVVAIGNALGEYNNSVSVGIVSGLNRTVEAYDARGRKEELKNVIQTDAAINLGNSGGPLLDLNGTVVGVNVVTAIGANDISFSIPINEVKSILDRIL